MLSWSCLTPSRRGLGRRRRQAWRVATWTLTGMNPLFSLLTKWIWKELPWILRLVSFNIYLSPRETPTGGAKCLSICTDIKLVCTACIMYTQITFLKRKKKKDFVLCCYLKSPWNPLTSTSFLKNFQQARSFLMSNILFIGVWLRFDWRWRPYW